MGPRHLNAPKASTIYDLGMGTGKVAMQVFLQFPNLKRVYGIELSQARFELGEAVSYVDSPVRLLLMMLSSFLGKGSALNLASQSLGHSVPAVYSAQQEERR